jgi:DNA-binding response OmpR family regulator
MANFADRGAATEKLSLSAYAHTAPEPGCADLSGVRILVVEDSIDLGMAMKSLLESSGAQVEGPVATTADADRLIAASVPDAALVDIHLRAGERADDLIGRLHERGVRVVVTSGDSSELRAPENAAATLTKPFSEAELFAALLPVTAAGAKARGQRGEDSIAGHGQVELRSSRR